MKPYFTCDPELVDAAKMEDPELLRKNLARYIESIKPNENLLRELDAITYRWHLPPSS